ncbi:MAG TPA: DUF1566 domain-containing protein [Thermotogota bacterium]|nr:DUF1566 domain-containing protein [Thermotogota bacterium]HRW93531.1 DUF1566 domain-containing protein [Thermotogota bacterium]
MKKTWENILGWIAVVLSTAIASLWAFWGIVENFHEGWYSESLWENLFIMCIQYLSFPLAFLVLTLVAIRWPRVGSLLFLALGIFFAVVFAGVSFQVVGLLLTIPGVVFAALYWFGRPHPRKWAFRVALAFPVAILLVFGIPDLIRVSTRVNDHDFGVRVVQGNQSTLVWAPRGLGWPDKGGMDWYEAQETCRFLSEDGLTLSSTPVDVWRLPTTQEVVTSLTRGNQNAGGQWDEGEARYDRTPDKETPLWNPHTMVIYWWTSDSLRAPEAYTVTYNGGVWDRRKNTKMGSLGFRAVKQP